MFWARFIASTKCRRKSFRFFDFPYLSLARNGTDGQHIEEGAPTARAHSPRSDWACWRCISEWEIDVYVYKLTSVEESEEEDDDEDDEDAGGAAPTLS